MPVWLVLGLCIRRTEVFDRFGEVCCPSRKLKFIFGFQFEKFFLFSSLLFSSLLSFVFWGKKVGGWVGEGILFKFADLNVHYFLFNIPPSPHRRGDFKRGSYR